MYEYHIKFCVGVITYIYPKIDTGLADVTKCKYSYNVSLLSCFSVIVISTQLVWGGVTEQIVSVPLYSQFSK